ncbi:IclR family transcriptional regulator [Peptoniphilus sp. MSJ-1]|uniref:IclR family transcriptional regulator n=1 Tax=Peptoniphilus ovalis TaxID=2841503 RepID=A0ABS6FDG8_9FIRM|nr:IclR family transcriptional regulator [Peptoniphilus ovalis]MBU5668226.1 IclR family transcriptional regulator [Peptoniphilus ovalis]
MHKPTERVLKILLTLASEKEKLTLTEISEKTNIPKSTISPILSTMVEMKFLSKKDDQKYKTGINTFVVGETYIESTSILEMIKSNMNEIVKECNEICQLGIIQQDKVFYIAKKEPKQSIQLVSYVGKFLPLYSTALGKVLIVNMTNDEIRKLIGNEMTPLTENTITDMDMFLEEIDKVRVNGYAYDLKETSLDSMCVAVPIVKDNKVISAMSVSVPAYRSDKEKFDEILKILNKHKNIIEDALEYTKFKDEDLI